MPSLLFSQAELQSSSVMGCWAVDFSMVQKGRRWSFLTWEICLCSWKLKQEGSDETKKDNPEQ